MSRRLPLVRGSEQPDRAHAPQAQSSASAARVVLVGYEEQDNLGMRYLSARLREAGHEVRLVGVDQCATTLPTELRADPPLVVGFSLIFQFLAPHFAEAIEALRRGGCTAHFTIGGHYASFEPEVLLEAIPGLDSVVRFEGEETLLELVEALLCERPLAHVPGLSLRGDDGGVVATASRHSDKPLDALPWPDREDIRYEQQSLPMGSILGSRGCPWRCSFCSIITFYEGNGTKGRRRRDPERVVDEMEHLVNDRGVRILLWQDDDFLAGGAAAVRWAHAIARESMRRGLHHALRWKISCRSDEVKRASLEPLVEAGLTHVYLGVESGDAQSLQNLNKLMGAEAHFAAKEVLRALGLSYDFGFMLLEPWSTLQSVASNLAFLREFAADGSAVATFCRTLPYAGTPIEHRLRQEQRLERTDFNADYAFLDPRLDLLYDWGLGAFAERNHAQAGTANLLRTLMFEAHLDLPNRPRSPHLCELIGQVTAISNQVLLDTLDAALAHLQERSPQSVRAGGAEAVLDALASAHARHDARILADLQLLAGRFPGLSEHASVTR